MAAEGKDLKSSRDFPRNCTDFIFRLYKSLYFMQSNFESLSDTSLGLSVGIIANMAAQRITAIKNINPDGSILEVVIWRVPKPVPPTEHGYKYRAAYVVDGVRIVGFDNERGKGDHCHMDGKELPYTFISVDQLLEDFIAAVETRRAS